MNKIIAPDIADNIYGCFRCGETQGTFTVMDDGIVRCEACQEKSVVTFLQALDILNDLYTRGQFTLGGEFSTEESLEYILTHQEDLDDEGC